VTVGTPATGERYIFMSPLIRGVVVTIALLVGGLVVTSLVATALEQRAARPVDQAYSPTSD
jgi:hypothetical protein